MRLKTAILEIAADNMMEKDYAKYLFDCFAYDDVLFLCFQKDQPITTVISANQWMDNVYDVLTEMKCEDIHIHIGKACLLYTSPSPRD